MSKIHLNTHLLEVKLLLDSAILMCFFVFLKSKNNKRQNANMLISKCVQYSD
jgi:hypothetical protein